MILRLVHERAIGGPCVLASVSTWTAQEYRGRVFEVKETPTSASKAAPVEIRAHFRPDMATPSRERRGEALDAAWEAPLRLVEDDEVEEPEVKDPHARRTG